MSLSKGLFTWKALFQPAINLAKNVFEVSPCLGNYVASHADMLGASATFSYTYIASSFDYFHGFELRLGPLGIW
ncbi:hypothetical protein K1719_019563 [Acacia pycnantha]|nr:hypothetical protein K1719_019563 [Acacia pycnantha]